MNLPTISRAFVLIALLAALPACRTVGYLGHVAKGHAQLMAQQQPVQSVLDDPDTDPDLRRHLSTLQLAREFAVTHLDLPRNRSYTRYVDLQREFVSWMVVATPEFSLEPVPLCLPIAGCVPYRGWFDRGLAERDAQRLSSQGLDTWIGGISAYSTLGWFSDPIVSSMLRDGSEAAVGTLFHELAHQRVYVAGDSGFNEAYASFVEREGLTEWRASNGYADQHSRAERQDEAAFRKALAALVERLEAVYASDASEAGMREAKQAAISAFQAEFRRRLSDDWSGLGVYRRWVEAELNNAALQPYRLYESQVPVFAAVFEHEERDWSRFHAAVEGLGRLNTEARIAAMEDLGNAASDVGE